MSLTALQIIQQAQLELGLHKSQAVAANLEVTGQQMLALLNGTGNDLLNSFPWQQLQFTGSIVTAVGTPAYDLPANYGYYIDQTFWNNTQNWPLIGPLSAQEWQSANGNNASVIPRGAFRIAQNQIELYPTPGDGDSVTYQYISRDWVEDGQTLGTYKNCITSDTDLPLLDCNLLVKALKVRMWSAKGLNTDALTADFSTLFNMLTGKSKGAAVLSLSNRNNTSFIGFNNVPDGNW